MNAVKQYIDLYNANKDLICRNSVSVLNEAREAALATLQGCGVAKSKDFSATDPEAMLVPDYAINLSRYEVPVSQEQLFSCDVPNLSTQVHYLVNEQYVGSNHNTTPLAEGVFAGSLRQFASEYPDLAARYYNRLAAEPTAQCSAGESALNTLLVQDGFVLYVPDDICVEKTIQLISLMRSVVDFMACQRILVIVGKRAKATVLLCDHSAESEAQMLNLQITEIFLDEDASCDFYALEEHGGSNRRLSQVYVSQAAGSNAAIGSFSLMAGQTRNRCHIALHGENVHTRLFGLVIADGQQKVDNITFIDHKAPHCESNELFKYVLDDEAQGSFIGRILVHEGAVKTEAHQTDRNLCLTPQARMLARPELEIYADDVKCSHGATVGQLDTTALFYMRTRGIPEAEARLLLMFAFMGDVIDLIRLEPLKDRLKQLVEKRFRGELTKCKTCKIK